MFKLRASLDGKLLKFPLEQTSWNCM